MLLPRKITIKNSRDKSQKLNVWLFSFDFCWEMMPDLGLKTKTRNFPFMIFRRMNFLTSDKIAIYISLNYEKNIKKKRDDTEWCQPCIPLYFHQSEIVQKFIQFNFLWFFVQTFINEVIWTNRSIVLGNETHKVKKVDVRY